MRQTHAAGEKLFVDFAGDTVSVFDGLTGEVREAKVFVAVLGASNYTYAEARFSEALPDWIGAHVNALAFLGGVPRAIVRSEEHTSELQSLMRISYAVFCLKKKKNIQKQKQYAHATG